MARMKACKLIIDVCFSDGVERHRPTLACNELREWLNDNCSGWQGAFYTLPDGRTGSCLNHSA